MVGCSRNASASLFLLFILFGFTAAKELLVGGKINAWKIPSSEADSLNQWAEKSRFRVGDHLGNFLIIQSQNLTFFILKNVF